MRRSLLNGAVPAALLILGGCSSPAERAAEAAAQGQQLLEAGQYAQAVVRLSYAVKQRDDLPGLWLLLGRAKAGMRDAPGAFAAYRNALDQDPGSRESMLALSQISLSAGKYLEAEEYADRLLLLSPGTPDALVIKGFAAVGAGRTSEAHKSADEVLKSDPANELALTVKSMAFYRAGDLAAAARVLEAPLARNTSNVDVLRQLRRIYTRTADIRGLVKVTARLAELNPDDELAHFDLARGLYLNGEIDSATKMLARLRPGGAVAHRNRVLSIWMDAAISPERLTASLPPDAPDWLDLAFAELCVRIGQPALAVRRLAGGGESLAPGEGADRKGMLALALLAQDRNSEAAASARAALAGDARQPAALEARGRLAAGRGDFDAAIRDARQLAADNPASSTGYRMLADIYQAQGNPVLADKAAIDASNAAPRDVVQLKYSVFYFRGRSKLGQAYSLAREFTSSNPLSINGWKLRQFVCEQQNDLSCLRVAGEFLRRLNGYPIDSTVKPENSNLIED